MSKQVALVDGDVVLYRAGFACEKKHYVVGEKLFGTRAEAIEYAAANGGTIEHKVVIEPVQNALHNINTLLSAIHEKFPDAEQRLFLTGKGNFRHGIATIKPYKGNRSVFARPRHYEDMREHMVRKGALVVEGMEADDEIGIQATELSNAGDKPIVVSTDKDLDMIPAHHYNWVRQEEYDITDEEAYRNFFRQCLTGDTVDNVPGIFRVGPDRAGAILANYRKPRGMLHATRKAWNDAYPKGVECHDGHIITADQALIEHGRLLWICRERNAPLWHPEQIP